VTRPLFYLRSYPVPDGMRKYAAAVEEDGWDGLLFTDTQNLSMEVFASLYLASLATARLKVGTAVTNLVTRHPAVMASAFATLHHVSGGRAHLGVGRGDTALELIGLKPPSARFREATREPPDLPAGRRCRYRWFRELHNLVTARRRVEGSRRRVRLWAAGHRRRRPARRPDYRHGRR
jgi:alkanesulfonate monooxygenase SsuD/methylene tetrahydromethanopterin reductase-like flavin-dependent oxidoreductase (luciferase family)